MDGDCQAQGEIQTARGLGGLGSVTTEPRRYSLRNCSAKSSRGKTMKETQNLKILIAEDNPLEQATLKKMLEHLGCRVWAVGTGQKAVKEFVTRAFDLVLLDIMMPEMDGFAAARLIRERERVTADNTPLVALTSCSLSAIETHCHEADMDGYLAKPVEKDKLISMLKHLGLIQSVLHPAQLDAHIETLPPAEGDQTPIFAPQRILANLANDGDLLRELVDMYLLGFASQPDELAELLADGELDAIRANAHGLKGVTANLGGLRLAAMAEDIQQLCQQGVRPDPHKFAAPLRQEGQAFLLALKQIDWSKLTNTSASAEGFDA